MIRQLFRALHMVPDANIPAGYKVVQALRATWFGRLYVRYLKPHPAFHHFVTRCVNAFFPFYMRSYGLVLFYWNSLLFKHTYARWRPLLAQASYRSHQLVDRFSLVPPSHTVALPVPVTYPASARSYMEPTYPDYRFPETYVSQLKNCILHGKSNLVIVDKGVIHHDLYDFAHDATSEELHMQIVIDPKRKRVRWLAYDKFPETIPLGATFLDSCAFNYCHWTTEVLPRIVAFCADARFKHVPLIIDDGHHPNIMESLRRAIGPEREIILLAKWKGLIVETLYMTSTAGYIPFGRRRERKPWATQGKFSPDAFEAVRSRMLNCCFGNSDAPSPEKIYIRRQSGLRKVTNSPEIEAILADHGFVTVEPETLDFPQQVQLFSKAKVLVGSSGAALANILYMPKDAQIFVLMSKQLNNIYYYWQSIACAGGMTVTFVLGDMMPGPGLGIHADFKIEPGTLVEALGVSSAAQTEILS